MLFLNERIAHSPYYYCRRVIHWFYWSFLRCTPAPECTGNNAQRDPALVTNQRANLIRQTSTPGKFHLPLTGTVAIIMELSVKI